MSPLLLSFEAYRLALRALVLVMSAQIVAAPVSFLRSRRAPPPPAPADWPAVTVQLPLRNEFYAARGAIEAAAALDYPRDRLEIQVLDDSEDATVGVGAEAVAAARAEGVDIVHLRRFAPVDYKAGALGYGLSVARGELIAIFDADFRPPAGFLRSMVPELSDPQVAMVQARWEHANRDASWLTRLEAQVLDALMAVEQPARSRAGLPVQFNGTAGVWRKDAILAAGGWRFDSLTEDLDLSLRVLLTGRKLRQIPEVAVPSELPATLGLFRVQQRRWALGTAQLLRKRLLTVLGAPLPLRVRVALALQMTRHFGYPLLVVLLLTVPLTTFGVIETGIEYPSLNAVCFVAAFGSVALEHGVAARAVGRRAWPAVALSPFALALAVGLAPTYTAALWYGLRDRAGEFWRTPKVPRTPGPGEPHYSARRSILVPVEIALGLVYAGLTALAAARGLWLEAPFLAFLGFSVGWVGVGSLDVEARPAR